MKYHEAINYGNKILKLNSIKNYTLDSEILLADVLNSTRENLLVNLNSIIDKKKFTK